MTTPIVDTRPHSSLDGWAMAWLLFAVVALGYGMYLGVSEPSAAVGGDAYNYLIVGVRALLWIGISVVMALFAVCAVLVSG